MRSQVVALDELEGDEVQPLVLAAEEDAGDVLVIELGGGAGFLVEAATCSRGRRPSPAAGSSGRRCGRAACRGPGGPPPCRRRRSARSARSGPASGRGYLPLRDASAAAEVDEVLRGRRLGDDCGRFVGIRNTVAKKPVEIQFWKPRRCRLGRRCFRRACRHLFGHVGLERVASPLLVFDVAGQFPRCNSGVVTKHVIGIATNHMRL